MKHITPLNLILINFMLHILFLKKIILFIAKHNLVKEMYCTGNAGKMIYIKLPYPVPNAKVWTKREKSSHHTSKPNKFIILSEYANAAIYGFAVLKYFQHQLTLFAATADMRAYLHLHFHFMNTCCQYTLLIKINQIAMLCCCCNQS